MDLDLVYCSDNCSMDHKVKPKRVMHHANEANPEQCLMLLYKKYFEHQPLKKLKGNIKAPVGHNTS